ncbi:phasin family protein [Bradyrhizobium sp. CB82]|uniref:phasin family protein n=1 Tax=Bradyrhizobium sp. CB82 TaxID=3039159 RepID=UPI0024B04AEA|nr:phasin family protein [Bradyrhizobium sp. CB82]WFU37878.1 phasin family protein [Bradyrhizobium sp. CB82]
MKNQALEVPSDVRELVERTIDQTEKAFSFFFQAAQMPFPPPGDLALDLAQRNVATSLEYARKLACAKNLQEVIALQAEYLRLQIEHASEFMRELAPKR